MTCDEDTIIKAVHRALNERESIDRDTHREHHRYVGESIDRHMKRNQQWSAIRGHVIGWGIVTFIGGIGYSLWDWLKHSLGK